MSPMARLNRVFAVNLSAARGGELRAIAAITEPALPFGIIDRSINPSR